MQPAFTRNESLGTVMVDKHPFQNSNKKLATLTGIEPVPLP